MTKTKLTLPVTCEDCLHYKQGPAIFEETCSKLGVAKFAPACRSFQPSTETLSEIKLDLIKDLGNITKDLTPSQCRVLSYCFANASQINETEFTFGQEVYVCLGRELLSHYFKGYIVGIAYTREHFVVVSNLELYGDDPNTVCIYPFSSVLSESQWEEKKKYLIESNQIGEFTVDEIKPDNSLLLAKLFDYSPPTFDMAPKELLALQQKRRGFNNARVDKLRDEVVPNIAKSIAVIERLNKSLSDSDNDMIVL